MFRPLSLLLSMGVAACGAHEPTAGSGGAGGAGSATLTGAGGGGGGGGTCDGSGECGDQNQPVTGCVACAEDGPCESSMLACQNSEDCLALAECDLACPHVACAEECARQHPVGAELLFDFLVCVLCEQCPADCATDTSQCP